MSTEATDAGLDTPDEDAAPAHEKPRLRVTVASDTKSVEMWVRPTASCDLLRARGLYAEMWARQQAESDA